jgi:signal transduction histidine kinase/CheY-like chemotaxis protein
MQKSARSSTTNALAREVLLDEADLVRRLVFVNFGPEDVGRISTIRSLVEENVGFLASTFFDFLAVLPEANGLMSNPALLSEARLLKEEHLRAMVGGDYGQKYAQQRLELALLYADAGLDTRVFLGAFHCLLRNLGFLNMKWFEKTPMEGFENFMALKKIAFFDIGLITDTLDLERRRFMLMQQKELEEQLCQAQKMEAVGRLAGGIAHDFNNIVTIINGYGEEALHGMAVDDPNRALIEPIAQASQRAGLLTRQLLAFSRKLVLQPEVLDLNMVVERMGAMVARILGEHIKVVVIPKSGLHTVYIDPSKLEQIIMNLVINARDAMPSGGDLTIETANTDLDEEFVHRHGEGRPGAHVMIAISDTGVGMDAQTQTKIFEPFFTTKGVGIGTGLGLSTVYGIVKQSEGTIWVYSELGIGTVFKVYLPRYEGAVPSVAVPPPPVIQRGHETILLVEDENALRGLFKMFLTNSGYRVLETGDVDQALEICRRKETDIDLLLTDMVMPKMNGRKLAEQVVALRPKIKVAFMSGYTDDVVVHQGLLQPGTAFIEKPIGRDELLKKIRDFLDGGTAPLKDAPAVPAPGASAA